MPCEINGARKPKNFKVCICRNIIETLLCLAMHLHLRIYVKITLKKKLGVLINDISVKITLKKKLSVLISDEKVFKF